MIRTSILRSTRVVTSSSSRGLATIPADLVDLQTKLKERKPVSINNVRNLLLHAHESYDNLCFALKGVRLFNAAGYDLSDEVSTLVVKSAIAVNQPMLAAQSFLKNDRLTAYLTKRSAAQLVTALVATEAGVEPATKILASTQKKGIHVAEPALTLALKNAGTDGEVANRLQSIAKEVLGNTI